MDTMSGGGAPMVPGAQKNTSFLGSEFLSTITGLQSGGGTGFRPTGNIAGFAGKEIGNKIYDASNPAPPNRPNAPPAPPNDQTAEVTAARRKARVEAGQGSAANILAGNGMGTQPKVSSNILLGS